MVSVTNTDPTTDIDYLVRFETQEEKDTFIKKEMQYCVNEHIFLRESKTKSERDKFKKQLFNKRMQFLVRMQFVKDRGNVWTKFVPPLDDENDPDPKNYGT
jgi:hypothetical protein